MGDKMTPMSFEHLVNWVMHEHKESGTVFGLHRPYEAKAENKREIFDRTLETPIGPAAGPHTQLTQNIAAAYYAGSRFFELKTVQIIDGDDLPVSKPCIRADDECYNVEWSTELYVPQAMDEYIKAWFLLKVMAKEFDLGDMDGFQFNMSVGYDLAGIQSEKINKFIDTMMNAADSETFKACRNYLLTHMDQFKQLTVADVENISAEICNSATISTLHGCPPQEIERIANYLIKEKHLNTFIKCNPTLLGYEFARATLDEMGYDYIVFGDFHFKDDLQYVDAVPMLKRLMALCDEKGLSFGVKITNTFPVDIKQQELPGEEMYMSGKSLYPLSISLAAKLAEEFDGKLRISYSGGADFYNIKPIIEAGVWPVTMATTMLKPGGYQRLSQIAKLTEEKDSVFEGIDVAALKKIAALAVSDAHHIKAVKPVKTRKIKAPAPLTDCFMAPCQEGCPIHQDITTYMQLVGEGRYEEALQVILEKNPLPFITGTICAHNCMSKCTRNFYEEPVHIRTMKLKAAEEGYAAVLNQITATEVKAGKVAVVGAGPAGLSAAYFLARGGADVTVFEKADSAGGVVRHVIPDFRIETGAIEKDIALIEKMGVKIQTRTEITQVDALKADGYTDVVLAVGASKPGSLVLQKGAAINALQFLADYKKTQGQLNLGKNIVVLGGGNTAMDTARAAKKLPGVENVYLVYRRTKRYMPADAEELSLAVEEGIIFKELLAPVKIVGGQLTCEVMSLGDPDESGRRSVKGTGEFVTVPADTVIAAVGEQVDVQFYVKNKIRVNERGRAIVDQETLASSVDHVYVVGDGLNGPATVVEGIRDGKKAAEAILQTALVHDRPCTVDEADIYAKRGELASYGGTKQEADRCLSCHTVCENCVEVCPNRANIAVKVPGMAMHQIVHVDYMCNECGNCNSFCPYSSAPYQNKWTLFANENDLMNSENQGFMVIDRKKHVFMVRIAGEIFAWKPADGHEKVSVELEGVMKAVCDTYSYLLDAE